MCLFISALGYAQTDAISYQAVILNPDVQQLPGFDVQATVLPETDITLRFTIINENGFTEYQEVHEVTTDTFGMVNLFIGEGIRTDGLRFTEILWRGEPKNLLVEIDFYRLGSFVQLSAEKLTFTPQAYHRDIIATGDLEVDGTATFNDDFVIEGETMINNNLDITGNLKVGGTARIASTVNVGQNLIVEGITVLNNDFFVNRLSTTTLSGELRVNGFTNINNSLNLADDAVIGGAVSIGGDTSIGGDQLVEGDVDIRRGLTVFLNSNLNNDLSVAGRTDLGGLLNVDGATTIDDAVTIAGPTAIGDDLSVAGAGFIGAQLDVIGKTTVGGNLEVIGLTSLNNDFKVDGGSNSLLTGPLTVDGKADFNNSLTVNNASPTVLGGTLQVVKNAVFDDDVLIDGMLTVNNNLNLPNLVVSGDGSINGDHVALFENTAGGGADGIAIRINNSELSSGNNFVTFYGQGNYMAGRIESFDAASDMNSLPNDISNTNEMAQNQGIVYGSKGADYAEWLEKENPNDSFMVGEVVGIKGGKISRNTQNADHVLTISLAPIVLGNMPEEDRIDAYEKVGFMGQVPALVNGKVAKGDYIVASGSNDGFAVAIAPQDISLKDLKWVIGKAWSSSEVDGKSLINVSVGLKSNEWVRILELQDERIQHMESKLRSLENLSEKLKKMEAKMDALDMN
jgi:carbonic anhydrase/acetyltransferase-like protein (isoleucine patch superfamily)